VRLLSDVGEHSLQLGSKLISFKYTDTERGADTCSLVVSNRDLAFLDDPIFKKGNRFVVSWGYPGRMAVPREVVITKVKGSVSLKVEAKALSELMNKNRKARTFENKTRAEAVREIAGEYGWGESARFIQDTGVRLPHIHQAAMTDAQFVMRLARLEGFQFYVDSQGFHFHERDFAAAPTRIFHYYTDPNMGEVESFDIENDITAKPGRVRRRGRDPLTKEDVEGDSAATAPQRTVLAPVQEVYGTESEELLQSVPRPPPGEPEIVIDPETRGITIQESEVESEDVGPTSDAVTASREAEGLARRAQQVAIKLKLNVIGDPMVLAKTVCECRGFGRRLSVRYYVRTVEHNVGGSGYKMTLQLVSDGHGGHDTSSRTVRGLELLDSGRRQRGNRNTRPGEGEAAEGGNAEQLTPQLSIDPETGRETFSYHDSGATPSMCSPE